MSTVEVIDQQGKKAEKLTLDKNVFDGTIADKLMHQAVVTYLSNQRKGLACTKTKGKVSGGGKKPYAQKGTGRARAGSIRSPLWRSGGTTFGPLPHDFSKTMPKRMKALALKSALNAKLKDKELLIVDDIILKSTKTKELYAVLTKLGVVGDKVMLVVSKHENNLRLASRNLPRLAVEKANTLHTYAALNCKKLLFTVPALKEVQERIKKWLS